MYQSSEQIYTETKQQLKKRITQYIHRYPLKRCKALRRKVRMDKYIESNDSRQDARIRYSAFPAGMEILQKSHEYTKKIKNGYICFEVQGLSKNGEIIFIHLREEECNKDKILFLISTFYKKK